MSPTLRGQSILILGLGATGLSVARYAAAQGAAAITVADTRALPPQARALQEAVPGARLLTGPWDEALFMGVDRVVASPGVPLRSPGLADAVARGIEVVGDVELFAWALAARQAQDSGTLPVIAITGANGKSTVTTLVGRLCEAAGLETVVAGNIGVPVLDALAAADARARVGGKAPDVYVLELSSFQLETTYSLNARIATVLNISEDHMDRYASLAQYAAAKARIFQGEGLQLLNRDDPHSAAMRLPGRRVETFGLGTPEAERDWGLRQTPEGAWLARGSRRFLPLAELRLVGLHNAANALAATAAAAGFGVALEPAVAALRQFDGLPHRTQWVADVGGVAFYDDSKGTNVGAVIAALQGMARKVVLIAGGDGKGQDFAPLAPAVEAQARAVVLIGRDASLIASALKTVRLPILFAPSLGAAVDIAFGAASPGDAVLLSPACASFDMFRNYEHRAQVFTEAVRALAGRVSR
ncbi:MAG: UDP-N-acetylmuramoyl-L-alanine--D-glutamate ligase [Betaproteobacteria bacterium]|nr:UDP-N-acetylmuramoyl-L-alanine--D-glutamate ligase [Betaproteobacteria bacterium]